MLAYLIVFFLGCVCGATIGVIGFAACAIGGRNDAHIKE